MDIKPQKECKMQEIRSKRPVMLELTKAQEARLCSLFFYQAMSATSAGKNNSIISRISAIFMLFTILAPILLLPVLIFIRSIQTGNSGGIFLTAVIFLVVFILV